VSLMIGDLSQTTAIYEIRARKSQVTRSTYISFELGLMCV